MEPTREQADALDRFATGESLAIVAGAGTGKTSTLVLLAEASTKRGRYMAFNKAIVNDSATRFPPNVACSTIHSIAHKVVGQRYSARIQNSARMRSDEIARIIGTFPMTVRYGTQTKVLQPGYLAGLAVRSVERFCQSADHELGPQHVPFIDGIDDPTKRDEHPNNDEVRAAILPAMQKAWDDYEDPQGRLPYKHAHYLKAWHLLGPRATVDFLMVDEAQDLSPVMLDIVQQQTHAQLVLVGDPHQSIYAFTGAVNAFDHITTKHRTQLSQSFRFGPAIADVANDLLALLGADLELTGLGSIDSRIVEGGAPDAILCRTNATAVTEVMRAMTAGRRPHLFGGGDQVIRFAEAAQQLKEQGRCWHPDLACFNSWKEVQDYTMADEQGGELKLLVDLVDQFGAVEIAATLQACADERDADLVVSTAHKAKGREWNHVRLAGDFPDLDPLPVDEQLRLLYVAVTRAKLRLDISNVPDLAVAGLLTRQFDW